MMDAETLDRGVRKKIAFLSSHQAKHYGGWALATHALGPDVILPPAMLDSYWQDLSHLPYFQEVGHA